MATNAALWWQAGARRRAQSFVEAVAQRAGVPFAVEFRMANESRVATAGLESYFAQTVDVRGDLGSAFAAAMTAGFDLQSRPWNAVENRLHEWRHSNGSRAQAKANARAHNDFYRPWLDEPLMMYTCGYWPEGT